MSTIVANDYPKVNQAVNRFAKCGFAFTLLRRKDKTPFEDNWQNRPHNQIGAEKHLRTGGNIGVHAGHHSNKIIWLDLDRGFSKFLDTFPSLRASLIVIRHNAQDRGKVAIRITDRLPRSQKWKPPGSDKPELELLSTGNQAAVIGTHPSGSRYENNDCDPVEMTFVQLSAIWWRWTGTQLNDPAAPKAETVQAHGKPEPTPSTNPLALQVKEHWDCIKVFEHFDKASEQRTDPNGDVRLMGNGGLLIKPGADVWYSHADEVGGDCINAWAWCKTGSTALNKTAFVKVCYEMLEAVGVVQPRENDPIGLIYNGEIVNVRPDTAFAELRQKFSQPEAYPRNRHSRYDRAVMLAFLDRAEAAGHIAIKLDVRTAGEISGMGFMAASRAIKRLVEYNYLERCEVASWFTGQTSDERDQHIVNQFEAYAYQLTHTSLEVCKMDTDAVNSAGATHCIHFAHFDEALDAGIVQRYLNHDAFMHGAKETETSDESLGKAALDIIAALTSLNEQTFAGLAESTKASRTTVSRKCKLLEALGLVELYKEGRATVVYLIDAWEEWLERVWLKLTTCTRGTKRKIAHLEARLQRANTGYWKAAGGALRLALSKLIGAWKAKLFALNRQLSELSALRRGVLS